MTGISLGLKGQFRGGGSFSPADLFANDEAGGFFNPYNISTMYQDSSATTPVTAADQRIGLISSEINGLTFGGDTVTNGDFSGGSTGWTLSGTEIAGGQAVWSSDNIDTFILQAGVFEVGKRYRVKVTVDSYGAGDLEIRFGGSTTDTALNITGAGVYYASGVATGTAILVLAEGNGTTISVGSVEVEEMQGLFLYQETESFKPRYRETGALRHISFDDTDESFKSMPLSPAADKMQFFAAVRKRSNTPTALLAEYSENGSSTNGGFYVGAPGGASTQDYAVVSRGTSNGFVTSGVVSAPTTNVITALADISGDSLALRVDGAEEDTSASDMGTGNFGDHVLYIGARTGSSLFFTGDIYGFMLRFGPNLSLANDIEPLESLLTERAGLEA